MKKGIAIKCLDCGGFMIQWRIVGKIDIDGLLKEYWKCLKCHREVTTKREIST